MPVTLAQAKVAMPNKIDQQVADEFRRSSILLDLLTFDDAVSPTGGSTLAYGYQRLETPSLAQFRAINTEYTAQEAARSLQTVYLKVFGGAFEIDRVIQDTSGRINEANFQLQQKILGARNLFHNTVINGDAGTNANAFDGLNKALVGKSTELNTGAVIDLTTDAAMDSQKYTLLDTLDDFLSELSDKPDLFMANSKLINKIKSVARRAGYLDKTVDGFGRTVESYNGTILADMGYYVSDAAGTTTPVIPIVNRTVGTAQTGLTDLYAVKLGMDGFHGVSPTGNGVIKTYMPDWKLPGAVKKGEVEMVAAVALKQTRKAGVLRNLKVQ